MAETRRESIQDDSNAGLLGREAASCLREMGYSINSPGDSIDIPGAVVERAVEIAAERLGDQGFEFSEPDLANAKDLIWDLDERDDFGLEPDDGGIGVREPRIPTPESGQGGASADESVIDDQVF